MLITGSRDWVDKERMWYALDRIAAACAQENKDRYIREGLQLVSGHARGADALAEHWALTRFPLEEIEVHRADWSKGKRAGIIRNTEMVDSGPDMCAAFIMPCSKPNCPTSDLHGSHGATHCADYAERQGVPVSRFYGGALA